MSAVSAERCGRARAGAEVPGTTGDPGLERERTRSAERAVSGRTQSEDSLASFRGSPHTAPSPLQADTYFPRGTGISEAQRVDHRPEVTQSVGGTVGTPPRVRLTSALFWSLPLSSAPRLEVEWELRDLGAPASPILPPQGQPHRTRDTKVGMPLRAGLPSGEPVIFTPFPAQTHLCSDAGLAGSL